MDPKATLPQKVDFLIPFEDLVTDNPPELFSWSFSENLKTKLNDTASRAKTPVANISKLSLIESIILFHEQKSELAKIKQHIRNLDQLDSNGNSAYHYAIAYELFDVFMLLLESEMDTDYFNKQNKRGEAPIHLICYLSSYEKKTQKQPETEKGELAAMFLKPLLRRKGINPNIQDNSGLTPLHICAANGFLSCITLLVETGSLQVNLVDQNKNTALFYSAYKGYETTTSMLIRKSVDVKWTNINGKTAMHIAVEVDNQDICYILASNGGDISLCYQYRNPNSNRGESNLSTFSQLDKFGFIKKESNQNSVATKKSDEKAQKKRLEKERQRELKWAQMVKSYDAFQQYIKKHQKELRERLEIGLPDSLRPEGWKLLTNIREIQEKHRTTFLSYENLKLQQSPCAEQIDLDINRSARDHIMFKERFGPGQTALFNVLKAYSIFDPELGYCQGMSDLTAFLLMYVPEVDAFWMLVNLIQEKKYGLRPRLLKGFPGLAESWYVYERLLEKNCPKLLRHFNKHELEPLHYSTKWFMLCFLDILPHNVCLRIYDLYFYYGYEVTYVVALALMKIHERELLTMDMGSMLMFFKSWDRLERDPDEFIHYLSEHWVDRKKLEKYKKQYELQARNQVRDLSTHLTSDPSQFIRPTLGKKEKKEEKKMMKEEKKREEKEKKQNKKEEKKKEIQNKKEEKKMKEELKKGQKTGKKEKENGIQSEERLNDSDKQPTENDLSTSQDKAEKKSQDKAEKKSQDKTEKKSQDKAEKKSQDKVENGHSKSQDKTEKKQKKAKANGTNSNSEEMVKSKSAEKQPLENGHSKSQDKAEKNSQDKTEKKQKKTKN